MLFIKAHFSLFHFAVITVELQEKGEILTGCGSSRVLNYVHGQSAYQSVFAGNVTK